MTRGLHGRSHKSHFVWKFTGKMAEDTSAASVLCEPAQSKCTWTFHKSHFVWKFTGKMPNASDTTSMKYRALTPTVRTPQCGHTVWGTTEYNPKQSPIIRHHPLTRSTPSLVLGRKTFEALLQGAGGLSQL